MAYIRCSGGIPNITNRVPLRDRENAAYSGMDDND